MSDHAHPLAPFFGTIPLFSSLNEAELNDILRGIRLVSVGKGEVLFSEGDTGDSAYVIEKGRVEVSALGTNEHSVRVAMLGPGDVVGELALIDGAPRNATIRAETDSTLLRIDRGEFAFLRRNARPAAFKLTRAAVLPGESR